MTLALRNARRYASSLERPDPRPSRALLIVCCAVIWAGVIAALVAYWRM